jgi:hypothetical protein
LKVKSQLIPSATIVVCLALFLVAIRRNPDEAFEAVPQPAASQSRSAAGLSSLLPFGWIVPLPDAHAQNRRTITSEDVALAPKAKASDGNPSIANAPNAYDPEFDEALFEELYEGAVQIPPGVTGGAESISTVAPPAGNDRADMS